SSRYEGLPMTLLEAQVCGLPIVAYACKCGPRDIITEGENGCLIEERDVLGLAEKLVTLIKDQSLREKMGKASVVNSKRFNEDIVMDKWINLFNKLKN